MKKYLIVVISVVLGLMALDYLYFTVGILYVPSFDSPTSFSKAEGEALYVDEGEGFTQMEIKGVNLGLGKPGHYATDKAITKEEYLRWFEQIQEMGANVIRTYTIAGEEFYEAFYEYNIENKAPLYLIHGVSADDYLGNSSYSAWDEDFYKPFMKSCKTTVDVVHGHYKIREGNSLFKSYYKWDISPWVYGYILGTEWESTLVSYTDNSLNQRSQLRGEYFYTEDASNFEIFLATVGEEVASYETKRYGTQRVTAFSNWATTDPLEHTDEIKEQFQKSAEIDVEHIHTTDAFVPGQFASYHIYPYYPDYYSMLPKHEKNTYLQYLTDINEHHSMPVVVSEFGVPSSRGKAAYEAGMGRNQGGMSETEQGEALVSMYQDIKKAGGAGGIAFNWQDEWFKGTWNTMAAVDLTTTPYWSDYQTNEQYFGLLSFDPGEEKSVCYVDGDRSDWSKEDLVSENNDTRLSMKYDEKFIYFLIEKEDFDIESDRLYIPIDTTPKSGSRNAENLSLSMNEDADFVIDINGKQNSRLWVQEYYNITEALFYEDISAQTIFSKKFPKMDSKEFTKIRILLQKELYFAKSIDNSNVRQLTFSAFDRTNPLHYKVRETYETGKLTYGNANPESENFNSLADFCAGNGYVEIKLPWQLLNFADPSSMKIHDDYYENYGVEYLDIDEMKVGAGDGDTIIEMETFPLEKLGKEPAYHERLKESYYILQEYWNKE